MGEKENKNPIMKTFNLLILQPSRLHATAAAAAAAAAADDDDDDMRTCNVHLQMRI